ncbi:MAG: sigma-54 dependent transcriptional regulator [Planctomycetota bacterium]
MRVLFADDERSLQELMRIELPRKGHEVTVCPDGLTAVAALEVNTYDCIIVDLDMPGMTGIEVIGKLKEISPETEAVVLTGKSSLETAIAALRHGAFDYLTKPCKLVQIDSLLMRIAAKRQLANKYRAAKQRLEDLEGSSDLIGETESMQAVRRLIAKVAQSDSTVLIRGETGTGKELVARSLHDQSPRETLPFVTVNCGALPENLIESELFGHRKGAFTGADEQRVGLFEVADGGTLFLDEIGELPKAMQAKLLRVLESGEVRRVGDNQPFVVDVRVVCATHRDLEAMVDDEGFRQDLLFRVNTFEVVLPPLRDRTADVPALAIHLLERFAAKTGRPLQFSPEAMEWLVAHDWPGNVRELANVVEHASILSELDMIGPQDLPQLNRKASSVSLPAAMTLRELELFAIDQSLQRHDGNKSRAAEELGISLKTLYNKLNQAKEADKAA